MSRYRITRPNADDIIRKTRTSAAYATYVAIYGRIEAGAGLDTPWGWRAARAASDIAAALEQGVVPGWTANVTIGGETVTIRREE